jgi:hypothetical protein
MTKHLKKLAVISVMIMTIFIGQYFGSLNVQATSLSTQSAPVAPSAGGPSPSSTLVQTVRGSDNWIYTRTSTTCGATWSSWTKDGQMMGSSDTVSFYNTSMLTPTPTLVQTVRGTGDWIYTRTSTDGQIWSSWVKDGQMYGDSDTVVFYDYSGTTPVSVLVQTVRGTGNWIYTRYSTNGQTWSPWAKDGQMYGDSDTVVVYDYNPTKPVAHLVQTVRGTGDWIYTRTSLNGITWTSWVKNGQMYDVSDTLAVYDTVSTPKISRLIQTVKGAGNWIYSRASDNYGQTWSSWSQSGQMISPSTTDIVQNKVVQTVRGAGDWIYTRTSTNGLTWSSWVQNGQMLDRADVESCYDSTITADRLVQTVRGSGNWIYTRNTADGTTWSNWVKDGQMLSPSDTVAIQ